ncbi:MAG TPA: tetratricopeptide repeat protein [Anaerolineae bacterium]|nr:tetratricopeptide repeat protein [Anaerolineae bacterium]
MINADFCAAVQRPDDQIDLAYAALLFARDAYPDLDPQLYLNQLDEWAADARSAVVSAADPIEPLNDFLFGELRFIGNRIAYNDPLNSYLNKAIDRRVGLPITLSVIYLEIGRRLGLPIDGIGLPGHFVVRYVSDSRVRYIDPFHQGQLLTEADCHKLVAELSDGQFTLQPAMLEPITSRQILARMLNNLKNAQLHQGNFEDALPAVERLLDLQPDEPLHVRDLGLLHYQLNHYGLALRQLEQYLVLANVTTADPVRQVIGNIQTYLARLN